MKTTRIVIIGLGLLGSLALLGVRWGPSMGATRTADRVPTINRPSAAPSFAIEVVKPRRARPLFGILPRWLEAKLAGHGELGFDDGSPGATIDSAGPHRVALRAEDWKLLIEVDEKMRLGPETRLVFSIMLADNVRTLRCRPDEWAFGDISIATRPESNLLDGRFRVELATCENVETGQALEWPPAPLIVQGRFERLAPK